MNAKNGIFQRPTTSTSRWLLPFICLALGWLVVSCNRHDQPAAASTRTPPQFSGEPSSLRPSFSSCDIILAPLPGTEAGSEKIRLAQERVGHARDPVPELERLGWLFVARARTTFDEGFYTLAEHCAACMMSKQPGSFAALLLRGHVLQNLHRFKEAEPLAIDLAARRGAPADFGLLGDVLMEQGRLGEAIAAYQQMVDLRPDLHSYARVAHLRWLKGDVEGAVAAMTLAVGASSPMDSESAAWVHTRLAGYQFQAGDIPSAETASAEALELQRDYPPALLLRGRLRMARGEWAQAIPPLRQAALRNPLPEYLWTLAEALQAIGLNDEAAATERQLRRSGEQADARSFAVYLATRRDMASLSVRLAEDELQVRSDVFTHDAMAWALAAAGRWTEARHHLERALCERTQDARLFYHAAVIAARSGEVEQASAWRERLRGLLDLLLPSERKDLETVFPEAGAGRSAGPNQTTASVGTPPK